MRALTFRIFTLAMLLALPAQAFDTTARAAWVYDVATGTVLMEKNADEPLPPASMSKLMTLNMLFEALHDGRVAMDTTFPVSTKAWQMGGSKMFVEPADRPTVEDLIHGIIINSGNDACVVVAEGLAGTEEAFARLMNERARQLGMTNSHFVNASGWPDPQHRMSMHDLGLLATRVIAPRLGDPVMVPGPPKRFAQGIGATLSVAAAIAHLGFGATGLAFALVGAITVAATLESVLGLCLGCTIFGALMRAGIIPDDVCEACNDLSRRLAPAGGSPDRSAAA